MATSSNSSSSIDRPILPPLHTLNLPQLHISRSGRQGASNEEHDRHDYYHVCPPSVTDSIFFFTLSSSIDHLSQSQTTSVDSQKWMRTRRTSSSTASSSFAIPSSREVSPSDDQVPSLHRNTAAANTTQRKRPRIILVPTSFDRANAVIYVPPPLSENDNNDTQDAPADASYQPQPQSQPQLPLIAADGSDNRRRPQRPLFLIGPAMEPFRHPGRRLAKGARVHPYRITLDGRPSPLRRDSMSSTASSDI